MRWKHLYTKLRYRLKPRGMMIEPAKDQSDPTGWMVEVKIAKWYMPWFIMKALKQAGIPAYFWPYLLWKAYTWKAAN